MVTEAEELNDLADKVASTQHKEAGEWASRDTALLLPHQKIQLQLEDETYDRDCLKQARRHFYGDDAEAYTQGKFKFSIEVMRTIDWNSIQSSNESLSRFNQATRSKYVCRWTFTNKHDNLYNANKDRRCPLCGKASKNQYHIQVCPQVGTRKH